ncbi:MAG TPA: AAA family ATPase [Ktedonobacterales bacterium]
MPQIILLNGGSSSGKTSIAIDLQELLPTTWLRFSIDDLVEALPASLFTRSEGLTFGENGEVRPGPEFQRLEAAWMQGIAAMARAGASIIIDDVFLSGVAARDRWRTSLAGLSVLWVGVRCAPQVAAAREQARQDRNSGMAAAQAQIVHVGMQYDLEVDTTFASPRDCAERIAERMSERD